MTAPQRYPLAWPAHRPRTSSWRRRNGQFKAHGRPVTIADAYDRLDRELTRLGGLYPVLSSNLELRLDGQPRSGQRQPADPGVCLYFSLKGKPFALACDTYGDVAQNIAALAAHLEATRAIERHGVASAAESLEAFIALPPPAAGAAGATRIRSWREVLGFLEAFPHGLTAIEAMDLIAKRYRRLAGVAHPDNGGSDAAMAELNAARDAAHRELSS